jgi:hypothetical protein
MNQGNTAFALKRENQSAALAAIRALSGKGPHSGRFSWVDRDFATRCDNFHDIMDEWRWEPEYDDDGNVDNIEFTGEKIGDDKVLFDAIAPFVESGSYIEMLGEDGTRWKWKFDGKTCTELTATESFEDDETVTVQEQRRFTELMREFLTNASEIVVNADAETIKQAVEAAGGNHAYILALWTDFLALKQ